MESTTYKAESVLSLATIASPINDNLSLRFSADLEVLANTLAVIHGNCINIVPITRTSRRSKYIPIRSTASNDCHGKKHSIKQVKWVELESQSYFVVLWELGLRIYDSEVGVELFQHDLAETGCNPCCASGICVLRNRYLCVGTDIGIVWVFECNEARSTFDITVRLYAHDGVVTLLDSSGSTLITATDHAVYTWRFQDRDFTMSRVLDVKGLYSSPTAMKCYYGLVVVGYASGEFCIYDVGNASFVKRTVAHILAVSALDISSHFDVLTASTDCYVKLWRFDQEANQVLPLHSIRNDEGPVYGVGFLNCSGTEFCCVSSESTKVKVYVNWFNV